MITSKDSMAFKSVKGGFSLPTLSFQSGLYAGGSGQGRFLGTGSAALTVLASPRVSAAPASETMDGAASDTAASPPPARALSITFRLVLKLGVASGFRGPYYRVIEFLSGGSCLEDRKSVV